jgi:hypothetical protein
MVASTVAAFSLIIVHRLKLPLTVVEEIGEEPFMNLFVYLPQGPLGGQEVLKGKAVARAVLGRK